MPKQESEQNHDAIYQFVPARSFLNIGLEIDSPGASVDILFSALDSKFDSCQIDSYISDQSSLYHFFRSFGLLFESRRKYANLISMRVLEWVDE